MMSRRSIRENVTELAVGIQASTANNRKFNVFPVIIFLLFLAGAIPVLYITFKMISADYYHRQALSQANKSGTLTYQYLQKAETLNPYNDLYRVDLAQTNFALANALASQKGTSQTGQTPVALSDKDKTTIQTLLSQAINEGRASVALSPRSSRDWEVLASIYRNITGVAQNAMTFSLDAYGRAIQRDPLNPILRVNVGGIYYSAKNYDMAVRFFNDAISIKSDYANAYFNLALALRDQGDYTNAKLAMEQTVGLLQSNSSSPDYKTATQLLSDLTVKVAASAKAAQSAAAAPNAAGNSTSALTNPNLPKINVSDLNNPPELATPAAVTKKVVAKPTPIILSTTPTP
jgi:tetratricopeptide (TPR) repeat protein